MTKQKKGFLVFICSLIPGAGELYMGFRKQGMSIMLTFWGCIALAGYSGIGFLATFIVPLWFYSFFNVHNLKSLSEDDFYEVKDNYILHLEQFVADSEEISRKYRRPIAVLLLIFGISVLSGALLNGLVWALPSGIREIVRGILYSLPNLVLAGAIILAGLYLLNNKKQELDKEETEKTSNKEEHYWAPYRPFQQPPASDAHAEARTDAESAALESPATLAKDTPQPPEAKPDTVDGTTENHPSDPESN